LAIQDDIVRVDLVKRRDRNTPDALARNTPFGTRADERFEAVTGYKQLLALELENVPNTYKETGKKRHLVVQKVPLP